MKALAERLGYAELRLKNTFFIVKGSVFFKAIVQTQANIKTCITKNNLECNYNNVAKSKVIIDSRKNKLF